MEFYYSNSINAFSIFSACLFLVAGSKLEATVSSFLTKQLTCTGDIDRAKAIQR